MKADALENLRNYKKMVDKLVKVAEKNLEIIEVRKPIPAKPHVWQAQLQGKKVVYKEVKK